MGLSYCGGAKDHLSCPQGIIGIYKYLKHSQDLHTQFQFQEVKDKNKLKAILCAGEFKPWLHLPEFQLIKKKKIMALLQEKDPGALLVFPIVTLPHRSFNQQPNPNENQRNQLAQELGLSQQQIKYWFQNRRTSKKVEMERTKNDALHVENQRILMENMFMKESLDKIDEVSKLAKSYMEQPMPEPNELHLDLTLRIGCSNNPSQASGPNSEVQSVPLNLFHDSTGQLDENIVSKAHMLSVAKVAMDELLKLLTTNEPLWVQSSANDHQMILHSETYGKLFPRVNPLITSSKLRKESSKSSKTVRIDPMRLVEIFMNPDAWRHLFPTIISKARTIEMVERGASENRTGALSLMYENMHVLSPFVPSREFYFLRYCEKIEEYAWVITDVSFDYSKDKTLPSCFRRFPSGCLIHAMGTSAGFIEHVEVDDNIQTNPLYKDVVCTSVAYGAERWLSEIQRMCVKLITFLPYFTPSNDTGAGFQEVLTMKNDDGVLICISQTKEANHPSGLIVLNAAASFWLPVPSKELFKFFCDEKNRSKWDIRSNDANYLKEISCISNDPSSDNSIAILQLQPVEPGRGWFVIQESFVDHMISYTVHAPTKMADLNMALDADDPSDLFLLPSGITISEAVGSTANITGASSSSGNGAVARMGSSVTLAFQIETLTTGVSSASVESLSLLMSSTVRRIKNALGV
ncbi:hypothetical protein RIF29_41027 [Crotalaria pallida]|uniref:Uncharacterized protein n=1 Tax=Crotalaria pallida TaxID=3830 RepID=A0AAN9HS83_CROPI